MDLQDVIKKATLLPSASNAKFYRLKGLSQAEKDRKMNERTVKTPPNLMLLEDINDSIKENDMNKVSSSFDRHAIKAAIKEVNGGLDLSNKHWEKYWAQHLEDIMKSNMQSIISCKASLHKSTEANSENQAEMKNSKHQLKMKEKNKIFRNAAIMGLVNANKLSIKDLTYTNNKNCTKEENRLKTLVEDAQTDDTYQVEFVPLHEDPEVFVHPLRMGIDVKKFKDIDFTIPSVGKKIKETPQQYFLRTTDDNSFEFVRRNKSTT